ncbi:hypothetical protein GCM10010377_44740 [Streptomyces viridiviolaceus]|nr:hypothetical protein GCM10010377_44740 [Streptomyces viridiviolaceus]
MGGRVLTPRWGSQVPWRPTCRPRTGEMRCRVGSKAVVRVVINPCRAGWIARETVACPKRQAANQVRRRAPGPGTGHRVSFRAHPVSRPSAPSAQGKGPGANLSP